MDHLNYQDIVHIIGEISTVMSERKDLLCELDARLGDGDLGLTMSRGWAAAAEAARGAGETDIDKMLVKAGMKMSSAAPSTMGTLFASALMEAGKALKDKTEFGTAEFAALLNGFRDGIVKRGKCAPGDKTVLDAVWPAAEAAGRLDAVATLAEAAGVVRAAAREGLESTKEMLPKFGKAAVFAGKAKGLEDQGATAGYIVIDTICAYMERSARGE